MQLNKQIDISDDRFKSYLARINCNQWYDSPGKRITEPGGWCSGKNQRCHKDIPWDHKASGSKPFCGTDKCRTKSDCKDVGYRRQKKARLCNRAGRCVYNMDVGGFHLHLFVDQF